MKTIKQAADSLLSKGEITKDEYNSLEDSNLFNKEAGFLTGILKNIPLREKMVGVGLAAAAGLAGKELVYDPIKSTVDMKNSFEMMSKKVPQLAEKNQEDIKDYFNVIKTFSPKAASNPLVAGALVNKMMEFGGVDHKLVQDLAAIEAGMARPGIVQATAEAAAQNIVKFPKPEEPKKSKP